MKRQKVRNLIFLLGDQLSRKIASLHNADRTRDLICMCEVDEETTYVAHHKQKLVFVLSAMRHFAEELRHDGFRVDYTKLNSADNPGTLEAAAARALKRYRPERLIVTEAGEWRVQQKLEHLRSTADAEIEIRQDDRFLCSYTEFADWAKGRKSLRLEYFYRQMRRQTGFLMENENPAGGQWNFDKNNRKPLASAAKVPEPIAFQSDSITEQVIELVRERFAENFGDIENFRFATRRDEALDALEYFVDRCLERFGDYQDAMVSGHATLFHSILSGYINIGLLDPREVCERVVQAYEAGDIPLNSAEGFIRQIIGWREFVRGIYWLKMPAYLDENYFNASRDLPAFYWTSDTHMRCMKDAIKQTQEASYAHHIQRLMITGNFALLAGVDPRQVHEWYMAVYIDAFEWVEVPNTLGMSQFADGGVFASKPYAASGAYINRLSNYCSDCAYNVRQKTESDACPFNALYWDFLARNRDKLGANNRLSQVYANWDRLGENKQQAYRARATRLLERIEEL